MILTRRVRWTSQEPPRKAKERDDWAITPWRRQELPAIIRRARRRWAPLALRDASGIRLTPTVRRRFAPRGETPIPKSWDHHDRITALSAVTVSPKQRRLGQYFPLGWNHRHRC
jgi:hypothetical protein